MQQKRYTISESSEVNNKEELTEYSEFVRALLWRRGIYTSDEAGVFLKPDWSRDVLDPFLLTDMEKTIERILRAMKNNEKVTLFSDFDADGIPASVVMHDFFTKAGFHNFSVVIPHRNTQGFGLNDEVITECIENGTKLIITIDCGMGDAKHIVRATESGIEVIVTDHHLPGLEIPKAFAIVNPNQEGDRYPNKHLCGAGVIFKIVQALVSKNNRLVPTGYEKWLLDMVGIATLSDMVPLIDENRAIAYYGLVVLRKSHRVGLKALLSQQRINQRMITEDDVVFSVTPRINAASRMDAPELAFELLSTQDEVRAEALAKHLDSINNERKGVVAQMSKEIRVKVGDEHEESVLVVGNTHWRPGLLGLAATRAVEVYGKPVFVWGRGESTVIKGSVRGDGKIDVMTLMQETRELFLEFGGHKHSGGFSITVENLVKLPEAINDAHARLVKKNENPEDPVVVDLALSLDDVHSRTLAEVSKLSPFGVGNPKPVFVFENITVKGVEWFGKEKNHIKLLFRAPSGGHVQAIQFFAKGNENFESIQEGQVITLLGSLERGQYGRDKGVRLRIVEVVK